MRAVGAAHARHHALAVPRRGVGQSHFERVLEHELEGLNPVDVTALDADPRATCARAPARAGDGVFTRAQDAHAGPGGDADVGRALSAARGSVTPRAQRGDPHLLHRAARFDGEAPLDRSSWIHAATRHDTKRDDEGARHAAMVHRFGWGRVSFEGTVAPLSAWRARRWRRRLPLRPTDRPLGRGRSTRPRASADRPPIPPRCGGGARRRGRRSSPRSPRARR